MKVAMIGLGKLGLPVACAMAICGHDVLGYDVDERRVERYRNGETRLHEPDIDDILLECLQSGLRFVDIRDAVVDSEIIFVAVPTPSRLDGAFDVSIVESALDEIAKIMALYDDYKVIALISTVLPTTTRSVLIPVLGDILGPPGERYGFAYNAQFIAMGSVIENMLMPEFVLVGEYDKRSGDVLGAFYSSLNDTPILRMTIENAEIVKMYYNTFIGFKIIYANTVMEICDSIANADVDVVTYAIAHATDRLISSSYLRGGMGDGGPCHPRDQRALDYFAQQLQLSANPFKFIMEARRAQAGYIANVVKHEHNRTGFPVALLGTTFKPETNLTDESPALLLRECLSDRGVETMTYDPIIQPNVFMGEPYVYVISTMHAELVDYPFIEGSVIVDPWRMLLEAPDGCTLRSIGAGA